MATYDEHKPREDVASALKDLSSEECSGILLPTGHWATHEADATHGRMFKGWHARSQLAQTDEKGGFIYYNQKVGLVLGVSSETL